MNIVLTSAEISEILANLAAIGANPALNGRLDKIEAALTSLLNQGKSAMTAITDLQAAVAAQTSVDASAVTLIQGIATQLQALAATNTDAQLKALTDQLTAATAPLAAAVTANTPAAPAPAPAPVDTVSGGMNTVSGAAGNLGASTA